VGPPAPADHDQHGVHLRGLRRAAPRLPPPAPPPLPPPWPLGLPTRRAEGLPHPPPKPASVSRTQVGYFPGSHFTPTSLTQKKIVEDCLTTAFNQLPMFSRTPSRTKNLSIAPESPVHRDHGWSRHLLWPLRPPHTAPRFAFAAGCKPWSWGRDTYGVKGPNPALGGIRGIRSAGPSPRSSAPAPCCSPLAASRPGGGDNTCR